MKRQKHNSSKITFKKPHRPDMTARQKRIDKLPQKKSRIWSLLIAFPFLPINLVLVSLGSKYRLAFRELCALLLVALVLFLPGFNFDLPTEKEDGFADIGIDKAFFSIEGDFLQKSDTFESTPKVNEITFYVIQEGDSVGKLSRQFGITESTILWANGLNPGDILEVGKTLRILPVTGILYKVKRGDTPATIAREFSIKEDFITYQNELDSDGTLIVGDEIILPDAYPRAPQKRRTSYAVSPGFAAKEGDGIFVYPADGVATQFFHQGHYGFDIANPKLPPIYAADEGEIALVRYSGWNGGYGIYLVIDHGNGLQTLYAHLSKVYVKPGQKVARGEAIAQMGNTGRSTGPHLHFEVIENGRKKNPLRYF